MIKKALIALLATYALTALAQEQPSMLDKFLPGKISEPEEPPQYCLVEGFGMIDLCPEGKLMFFAPNSFGNKQLPLAVIARYCDTKQPVYYNDGGVVCTKTTRITFNVVEEAKRSVWETFKKEVEKEGSGWRKFNDTGWVKVVKEGTEPLPPIPYKMSMTWQKYDIAGKPTGKPQSFTTEITDKSEEFYREYPAGTEIEVAWLYENLLNSERGKYTIQKVTPIKEKPAKPSKGKK